MNQNLFERVNTLVRSLDSAEIHFLSNLLQSPQNLHEQHSGKLFNLLNYIGSQSGFDFPLSEGKKEGDALRKNLEGLEDRMLDSLLMDTSLDRNGRYSINKQFPLVLLKDRMKATVLRQRGCPQKAFEKLQRTAERHIIQEDYDSAIACLHLQISAVCLNSNPFVYKEKKDLLFTLKRHQSLRDRAIELFVELRMKKYFGILENLDFFIEDALVLLIKFRAESESKAIAYVLLYFEKEWAELQKDYHLALNCIMKMQEMVKQPFYLPQVQSIFELVYEQAKILLETDSLTCAKNILYSAKRNLPLENDCGEAVLELLFNLELSQGELDAANVIIDQLNASVFFQKHMPDHTKSKWEYLSAILYFRKGRTKKFMSHMRLRMSFVKLAKPDERLRLRIMEVLNAIDAEMFDLADRLQESLRKFISRNKLKTIVAEAHLFELTNIIWQLKYCGYDLTRLDERKVDLSEFMAKINNIYINMPLNHSIIRWDLWFSKRLKQEKEGSELYYDLLIQRREKYYQTGELTRLIAF